MKTIYKILVAVLFVGLSHHTLFAQYERILGDGTIPIISDGGGGGQNYNPNDDCFCNYNNDHSRLLGLIGRLENRDVQAYLTKHENILKHQINFRYNKSFNNFRQAQEYFFKKQFGDVEGRSDDIYEDIQAELESQVDYTRGRMKSNYLKTKVLEERYIDATTNRRNTVGDLKYKNTLMRNMPQNEVSGTIGFLNSVQSTLRNSFFRNTKNLDGLEKARREGRIDGVIANAYINHYNNSDWRKRIELMSAYLIYAKKPVPAQLWHNEFLDIYPHMNSFANSVRTLATNIGTGRYYTIPQLSARDALRAYAISELETRSVVNYVQRNSNIKQGVGYYLEKNKYISGSMKTADRVMSTYLSGQSYGTNLNALKPRFISTTEYSRNINQALRFDHTAFGVTRGTNHLSAMLSALYRNNPNYAHEGSIMRLMFLANDMPIPYNISSVSLGRLFNFNHISGSQTSIVFVGSVGQEFRNNGIPIRSVIQDPFANQTALLLANGDFSSLSQYMNYLINRNEIFYVDAGDKKIDPKKETKCFDLTKPAKVTIYVEQPIEGSREITAYVGHTFVGIEQEGISRYLGYYPENRMPSLISDQDAEIHDNSGSPYHVSISTEVSPAQLKRIIDHIVNFPDTYFLNTYNCADFGIDIGRRAGLNLPRTVGNYEQIFFKFEGRNPSDLGEDIRAMNSNPNITIEKTGGKAPIKKGGC